MPLNSLEIASDGYLGQAGQGSRNSLEIASRGLINSDALSAILALTVGIDVRPAIAALVAVVPSMVSGIRVPPVASSRISATPVQGDAPFVFGPSSGNIEVGRISITPALLSKRVQTRAPAYARVDVTSKISGKIEIEGG